MKLNTTEKTIMAFSVSLILISVLLLNSLVQSSITKADGQVFSSSNFKVNLNIDVYGSDGALKSSKLKEDDLVLDNFGELLRAMFKNVDGYVSTTASDFIRDSGAGTAMNVRYLEVIGFWEGQSGDDGAFIGIGTGTTTPLVSDYTLEAEVETRNEVGDSVYSDGNVTISTSIACTGTANITEAGLYLQDGTNNYSWMLFRDTFGTVAVVNGDSIVITYTIMLSTEFTDNFGKILAGMLSGITDNEATKTYSLTDVDGNSITVNYASGEATEPVNWVFDMTGMGTPLVGIGIGTGTTSPARADYALETQVEAITGVTALTYNGGNCSLSSVHVTSASRAITETGLFMFVRASGGVSEQILLWHDTFTAENVGDGEAITTTLQMSAN